MSTDLTYEEANPPMCEKFVCSNQDKIGWALGKVQQYSREHFKTMYLIQRSGFYWMTDYPPEFKKRIATVYPGGRIELRIDGVCAYKDPDKLEEK